MLNDRSRVGMLRHQTHGFNNPRSHSSTSHKSPRLKDIYKRLDATHPTAPSPSKGRQSNEGYPLVMKIVVGCVALAVVAYATNKVTQHFSDIG